METTLNVNELKFYKPGHEEITEIDLEDWLI